MTTELRGIRFSEIPPDQQLELNGGSLPVIVALAAVIVQQVVTDWDNFKNGLTGKPEDQ